MASTHTHPDAHRRLWLQGSSTWFLLSLGEACSARSLPRLRELGGLGRLGKMAQMTPSGLVSSSTGGDATVDLLQGGDGVTTRHNWRLRVIQGAGIVSASRDLITRTSGVRSGKPCIIGTRITVSDLLEYLASGMSQEEILRDFPQLRPEHIQAVPHDAAERKKRLGETILDS